MYFVREPSQAQSSDKIDVEIAALIEKATKQREQLDKLELAFNEARVCSGRLGRTLECYFMLSQRLALHCRGLFFGVQRAASSSRGSLRRPFQSGPTFCLNAPHGAGKARCRPLGTQSREREVYDLQGLVR